jgi:hypothetical protein
MKHGSPYIIIEQQ